MKDQQIKLSYNVCVHSRYDLLTNIDGEEDRAIEEWSNFKKFLVQSAQETVPKYREKNQKWITNVILDTMDQRRAVKGKDNVKYKELNTQVNDKCKQAKEKWWNEKCEELEKNTINRSHNAKGINKVKS